MIVRRAGTALALVAMLTGCGGSGSNSLIGSPAPTPTPTPTATATPTPVAGCSLRERQDWAAAQLREWYLFPETLPASLDPSRYSTVSDYVDALTATARSQGRDRYFTYVTSIAEENAYYNSGATAGFGVRFGLTSDNRLYVTEAFENAPALAAGIDRGTEIQAIGTSSSNLQTVSSIIANGGTAALTTAFGPDTVGTARTVRIANADGSNVRVVTVTKANFDLAPVSSRYGGQVIDDGGRKVGYINLRTFISTADPALRAAFANLRSQGVTNVIVDLRYNGGGLVAIAQTLGDLLGANRSAADVFSYTTFRPEKSSNNETRNFAVQPQSIAPTRIAFIGTGGTASASELTINAFVPYLHANAALIGSNTYGKPVGQIALDKAQCDDRLRVIAFATQNAARVGDYYTGLASKVEASCQASDDIGYQLGDPREASTRAALDFLAGRSCTRIGASAAAGRDDGARALATTERTLLTPAAPSTAQREVPGLF